jgi:hypothetical protein
VVRLVKDIGLAILRKPLPHLLTNLLLRLAFRADVALSARIYYPLNERIGKGARIGAAKLEGHPWRGVFAPTLVVGARTGVGSLTVHSAYKIVLFGGAMNLKTGGCSGLDHFSPFLVPLGGTSQETFRE